MLDSFGVSFGVFCWISGVYLGGLWGGGCVWLGWVGLGY